MQRCLPELLFSFANLLFNRIAHRADSSRNGFGEISFDFIHQKTLCRVPHFLPVFSAFFFLEQSFVDSCNSHYYKDSIITLSIRQNRQVAN